MLTTACFQLVEKEVVHAVWETWPRPVKLAQLWTTPHSLALLLKPRCSLLLLFPKFFDRDLFTGILEDDRGFMEESQVPTVPATCWKLSLVTESRSAALTSVPSLHFILSSGLWLTGNWHALELLLHGTYFPLCVLFWVTEYTKIFCKWFIVFVCDLWKYAQACHIFVSLVTQSVLEFHSLIKSVDPVSSYLLISIVAINAVHPDLSWWAGTCLLIHTSCVEKAGCLGAVRGGIGGLWEDFFTYPS